MSTTVGFLTFHGTSQEEDFQDRSNMKSFELISENKYKAIHVVWDGKENKWKDCKFIVVSSVWDYHERVDEFLLKLKEIHEHGVVLFNSYETVKWNSNKHYLSDLKQKGFGIIDTIFAKKDEFQKVVSELTEKDYVCKPVVSAAAFHTTRFQNEPKQISDLIEYCLNGARKASFGMDDSTFR